MEKNARAAALSRLSALLWPTDASRASHSEKWISSLGGFIAILSVLWVSHRVLDLQGAAMVVGSMGATAVLLFAVPHGVLSQPWPVFGGNLISALIGVSCAQAIADPILAAAFAVGLAIGAMHYLRCLHPPGGATALVAVLGGDAVRELGYGYLLSPVLENVLIILAVAVLVNLPFRHRRYPAPLSSPAETGGGEKALIAHSDLAYALSQLDSFIDVSEQDLIRIYTLAVHHTHTPVPCHQHREECGQGDADCLCRQLRGSEA
jgi:CBS-domain-containing membrane protein